jgi:hypothetical protein
MQFIQLYTVVQTTPAAGMIATIEMLLETRQKSRNFFQALSQLNLHNVHSRT